MCFGHGTQHVEEKFYAGVHGKFTGIAVLIDGFAVDVLKNQIWCAIGTDSGIEQFGYMRMNQPAKNAAFAFEPLFSDLTGERDVHELDGGISLEPAVAPLRQPDAAHSALPDFRDQPVGAYLLTRKPPARLQRRSFQEPFLFYLSLLIQERLHQGR
jgi:hypothetical protein